MSSRVGFATSASLLSCALALGLLAAASSNASVSARGKIVSASLTETSFTPAAAATVKLTCKVSPVSSRLNRLLQMKQGARWTKVRSIDRRGSFKGAYSISVKALFGPKAIKVGQYRVRVSADANSLIRKFTIKSASSAGSEGTGTRTRTRTSGGGDDEGDDGDDDTGDDGGTPTNPTSPPGPFAKTSPANAATGQPLTVTLSWSASSNASHYQYCVDATEYTGTRVCHVPSAISTGWVTASSTSASVSGLLAGKKYYWQVYAVGTSPGAYADGGTWFSFTT